MKRNRKPSLHELRVFAFMMQRIDSDYYGLEIMKGTDISAGTLYPILSRWEQREWVTSDWEDINESQAGRRRRRYYRLTSDGISFAKRVLEEQTKIFTTLGVVS